MSDPTLLPPAPIVDADWLVARLGDPRLVVVDCSWYLPAMNRDPRAEYLTGHIPGAVYWDLDLLSEQGSALPHMLPTEEVFVRQVEALGIGDEHLVVSYDGSGNNLSAARVWWELRVFGHDAAAVLDGGMMGWQAAGHPTEAGPVSRPPARFTARYRPELVRSLEQVSEAADRGAVQLLDARAAGRFAGTEPEPRPGIRGGHLPGGRNLPYGELVAASGRLKPREELGRLFRSAGIDLDRPVVTSCGSGVSACALALGLAVLGKIDTAVYDGSWTEWGGRTDTPIELGPPAPPTGA